MISLLLLIAAFIAIGIAILIYFARRACRIIFSLYMKHLIYVQRMEKSMRLLKSMIDKIENKA